MIKNEKDFINWLDHQLDVEIPDQIIAFNINIYESPFNIEIIGSNEFDPENEDWACSEDWVPENPIHAVSHELFGGSCQQAQDNIIALAKA